MPRNGSGVYSKPAGTTAVASTTIESAKYNSTIDDLVTDANTVRPIVAGGTGASSAATALVALGLTATAAEINIMDGVTATAAEINKLAGTPAGLTSTEIGYLDGVTSAIQTQLNAKQATITTLALANGGTGAALVDPNADRLMMWDDSAGAVAFLEAGAGLTITGTTMTAGGRVPLATKTASASATLDFTEFNNAVYKWYEFEFEDLLPATDATSLRMRFSTNAGVGYDAGASDYSYGNVAMEDGGTPQNDNATAATFISLINGYNLGIGNAAGELGVRGAIKLYGAGSATSKTTVMGFLSGESSVGRLASSQVNGRRTTAQDTDAVRFLMSSGNITSGTIRMYGIAA